METSDHIRPFFWLPSDMKHDMIISEVEKIEFLDKKVGNISQPPTNKKDKPKADPNKVYTVADAGSVTLGNPNAPVTVIKWTDFQ